MEKGDASLQSSKKIYGVIIGAILIISIILGVFFLSQSSPVNPQPSKSPSTNPSPSFAALTVNGVQVEIRSANRQNNYTSGGFILAPEDDNFEFIFVNATLSQNPSSAKDWEVSLKDEKGNVFGVALSPPIMMVNDSINYTSWLFQVPKTSNSFSFILPNQQTTDLSPFLSIQSTQSPSTTPTITPTITSEPSSSPSSLNDMYEPDNGFDQYSTITISANAQSQQRRIGPVSEDECDFIQFFINPGICTFEITTQAYIRVSIYDLNGDYRTSWYMGPDYTQAVGYENQLAREQKAEFSKSGYYFLQVKVTPSSGIDQGQYVLTTRWEPLSTTSPSPTSTPTTPKPTLTSSPTPSTTKYSLSEAIAAGYVEAKIFGSGSSSGDCISLQIKRLVSYTIEIEPFAQGTQLTTSSTSYQNMVIQKLRGIDHGTTYTPTSRILLTSSDELTYLFSAYCLNFHKSNPQSSTVFSASGTATSDVLKILNAANSLSDNYTTIDIIQVAVWVVTDNISLTQLTNIFPSGVSQIDNAKSLLISAGIDISNKQLFS
jgi:hypothetical protein